MAVGRLFIRENFQKESKETVIVEFFNCINAVSYSDIFSVELSSYYQKKFVCCLLFGMFVCV